MCQKRMQNSNKKKTLKSGTNEALIQNFSSNSSISLFSVGHSMRLSSVDVKKSVRIFKGYVNVDIRSSERISYSRSLCTFEEPGPGCWCGDNYNKSFSENGLARNTSQITATWTHHHPARFGRDSVRARGRLEVPSTWPPRGWALSMGRSVLESVEGILPRTSLVKLDIGTSIPLIWTG